MKSKVFLQKVEQLNEQAVNKMLDRLLAEKNQKKFGRVVIKPNLCFSERIPGATTTPELVGLVVKYFKNKKIADEITVVESDALLNTADEAFDNLGIRKAVTAEGGKIVNLSKYFTEAGQVIPHDLFVNLPVVKTHEFALVTGAVKNMFGMISDKRRIRYHPIIHEKLVEMCQKYENCIVIADGIHAMEGHGPTRGRSINLGVLIGGTNAAAVDRVMCKIMGVELDEVQIIDYAAKILNPGGFELIEDGVDLNKVARKFERPVLDPITATKMWIWRHKTVNNIMFASPMYKITRAVGLRIRKFTRFLLRMEKID